MSNYDTWKTRSDREDDMIDPTNTTPASPDGSKANRLKQILLREDASRGWRVDRGRLNTVVLFRVTAEEAEAFGLTDRYFMIAEDSDGYVCGTAHSSIEHAERAYRKWLGLPTQ